MPGVSMTKVRVSAQVEHFVKALAPEPRQALRAGIKGLAEGNGDLKPLEADLAGWQRLRVKTYRAVFKEIYEDGERIVDCVYVNRRSVVYDLFKELLKNQLLMD
jgi:mRNA-degrading endonuclease RelE of RelBE toxin-antitoxin system